MYNPSCCTFCWNGSAKPFFCVYAHDVYTEHADSLHHAQLAIYVTAVTSESYSTNCGMNGMGQETFSSASSKGLATRGRQ